MSQGIKQKTVAGIPVTEVVTETDLLACLLDNQPSKKIIEYILNEKVPILFGIDYANQNVICHDFKNGRPVPLLLKDRVIRPALPNAILIDINLEHRSPLMFDGANQPSYKEEDAVLRLAARIGLKAEEVLVNTYKLSQ